MRSAPGVADFLDGLFGPDAGEQLLAELSQSGEFPEILGPLAEGDYERALEWLMGEVPGADDDGRARVREVSVEIFNHLGVEHPVATAYRRRLAAALY